MTTATSSAAQATAQAARGCAAQAASQTAAKVARGWPSLSPARLPKVIAVHAAEVDRGDDTSSDMVPRPLPQP